MTMTAIWRIAALSALGILFRPDAASAQMATVRGTVRDASGTLLAGAVITARHEATGNIFATRTDEHGGFSVAVRPGIIEIRAEHTGLATVTERLELLVGRTGFVDVRFSREGNGSAASTAPAPSDTAASAPTGNIDPRQMQELPLNGRNWMTLTILAPGSRQDAVEDVPAAPLGAGVVPSFQLNLDEQQVTEVYNLVPQPRYSREAIEEFELISRFDATQGRSSGMQVNAITRSGTNRFSGSSAVYVRDGALNAADPVAGVVLPYSNQQVVTSAGGPLRINRMHVFGSYEFEREPQTVTYTTPYPRFNRSLTGTRRENKALVRFDAQFSSSSRLSARMTMFRLDQPYDPGSAGGSTRTPSALIKTDRRSESSQVTTTNMMWAGTLNEIRAGHDFFNFAGSPQANNSTTLPGMLPGKGAPQILLRGITIGQVSNGPSNIGHDVWSVRDTVFSTFSKGGRHDMRLGGEYLFDRHATTLCGSCMGVLDLRGGPPPANLEDLFPDITDVSTWNLAPLSPIARTYQRSIVPEVSTLSRPAGGSAFREYTPRHIFAGWLQDDWVVTPRLTLNLGLRYDVTLGMFVNWVGLAPFLASERPNDIDNVAPRAGFALSLTDRTVVRGGYGVYFADLATTSAIATLRAAQRLQPQVLYDGRSDFATNPFNGPAPSYEDAAKLTCSVAPGPSCLRPNLDGLVSPDAVVPYTHQASIGAQWLFGERTTLELDYAYSADRALWNFRNINVAYNPATGANYPFTDIARRPYPEWGTVTMYVPTGRNNYHGLQATLTKRMSHGWQLAGTYALDGLWRRDPLPLNPGCDYPVTLTTTGQPTCSVPIQLAADVSENAYFLTGAQRHRISANGIWRLPYGFQASGVYLFGDQGKATPTSDVDVRQTGGAGGRLRADGTLIPRNSFDVPAIHRLDLRIARRFVFGRTTAEAILEAFNVFNRDNYGSFVLDESNANFGRPSANTNLAYAPRMLQLGIRLTF